MSVCRREWVALTHAQVRDFMRHQAQRDLMAKIKSLPSTARVHHRDFTRGARETQARAQAIVPYKVREYDTRLCVAQDDVVFGAKASVFVRTVVSRWHAFVTGHHAQKRAGLNSPRRAYKRVNVDGMECVLKYREP